MDERDTDGGAAALAQGTPTTTTAAPQVLRGTTRAWMLLVPMACFALILAGLIATSSGDPGQVLLRALPWLGGVALAAIEARARIELRGDLIRFVHGMRVVEVLRSDVVAVTAARADVRFASGSVQLAPGSRSFRRNTVLQRTWPPPVPTEAVPVPAELAAPLAYALDLPLDPAPDPIPDELSFTTEQGCVRGWVVVYAAVFVTCLVLIAIGVAIQP